MYMQKVLVKDDKQPTRSWVIKRISKNHPGADGKVRVATDGASELRNSTNSKEVETTNQEIMSFGYGTYWRTTKGKEVLQSTIQNVDSNQHCASNIVFGNFIWRWCSRQHDEWPNQHNTVPEWC